jgi:hypothetical protein
MPPNFILTGRIDPLRAARGAAAREVEHGLYWAEALAEQKRVRELLSQSRELLKQMHAD